MTTNEFDLAKSTFELIDKKNRDYAKTVEMYNEIAERIKHCEDMLNDMSDKLDNIIKENSLTKYEIRAVVKLLMDLATV